MIISKKELLDVTGIFKSVVFPRSAIAILRAVNFKVDDGFLEIRGTDTDTFLKYRRPIEGAEAGEAAVDLKLLERAVRMASDEVEIKISSDSFMVRGIEIPTFPSEDFPSFPETESESGICRIHTTDFHEAMKRVLPFRDNGYMQALKHVLWESCNEGLSFTCSDGHRLSVVVIACSGLEEPVRKLVRYEACRVLNKAYRVSETLDFEWRRSSEQQFLTCRFSSGQSDAMPVKQAWLPGQCQESEGTGEWQMDTVLADGNFPDWRHILPSTGLKASVDVESLEKGVRTMLVAGNAAGVDLSAVLFTLTKGTLSIAPADTAIKAPGLELPCEYEGGPSRVVFNSKYLADVLKLLTGQVDLFLGDRNSASFFVGQDWLYALMPMNFEEIEYPSYPEADVEPIPQLTPVPVSKSKLKTCKSGAKKTISTLELFSQLKELREENRRLRARIQALSQKKTADLVPLEFTGGKAVAEVCSKKVAFSEGKILSVDDSKLLGTYDRNTGLGLLGDQPVWIKKNSRHWMLQTLDAVHEHEPEYILEKARDIIRDRFAEGKKIGEPTDAAEAIQVWLAPNEREVFGALFLDNSHRILAFKELFLGTIDRSVVYPREIAREALALNARAVILAHNHPSGDTTPSDQDIQVTQLLQKALALIKVDVLDHLIVGTDVTSLREKGLI